MNHLRELLDAIQQHGMRFDPRIQKEDADRYLSWTQSAAEKAPCFWMGDIDAVSELKVAPHYLVRMPFPTCWFEGQVIAPTGKQAIIGMLATETPGTSCIAEVLIFMRYERGWALMLGASFNLDGGVCVTGTDRGALSQAAYVMYALKAFLCAINCTNISRREHEPDAALQKTRTKKGKAPIFSYWTLELNGRSEAGPILGGTHASPRVHLRRGHPRQYAPGKWTWVQAHAVGDKTKGMVHKDYSVGPALMAAAR